MYWGLWPAKASERMNSASVGTGAAGAACVATGLSHWRCPAEGEGGGEVSRCALAALQELVEQRTHTLLPTSDDCHKDLHQWHAL